MAWLAFRAPRWEGKRLRLWLYFTLATLSHGLLDALTSYVEGVAFLSPFSSQRFFAPWRPFRTGGTFVGVRGFIANELLFGWLPSLLFAAGVILSRTAWRQRRLA